MPTVNGFKYFAELTAQGEEICYRLFDAGKTRYAVWPELTELLFITHKEISEVSENPLSRLSVISLIPTGYFG